VYKEIVLGLVASSSPFDYQKEMKARYNIDVVFGGCVVTDASMAYASTYNKVSIDGINRHFGRDVFKETEEEVEAEGSRAHPKTVANATR
jgi:hypothetical protein